MSEGYDGPVTILVGDHEVEVSARLRGRFEPIDGHYHWYGRVDAHPDLHSGDRVTLVTRHGRAEGRLSDVDPWGRLRVSGTGPPPYGRLAFETLSTAQ